LLVQVSDEDLPGGLQLAAKKPGEIVARLRKPVEQALAEITPAIEATLDRLTAMSPNSVTVEFGIILGLEAGAVLAKGSSEVHFKVTLAWQPHQDKQRPPVRGDMDSSKQQAS